MEQSTNHTDRRTIVRPCMEIETPSPLAAAFADAWVDEQVDQAVERRHDTEVDW